MNTMINDEELKRFHDWLHAKGNDPSIVLALRWVAEFELYAEEDEEDLRELKTHLASRNDSAAAMALKVITWVEETEEPDPMLKRLHNWLEAKRNHPTAVLIEWWLTEFVEAQKKYCPQTALMPTVH
jgi:hypothetical protein